MLFLEKKHLRQYLITLSTDKDPSEMIKQLDITKEYPAPEYDKITGLPDLRNGVAVRMPNHLGDAMMAMPALMQLKEMLPQEYALFVIAPASQKKLYSSLKFVSGFIKLDAPHKIWSISTIKEIKRMRLGLGILFNNSFRDAVMLKFAGIPKLAGSDRRMRKLILDYAFSYPPRPEKRAAEIHQANRLLQMVYALGAPEWKGNLPNFSLPPAAEVSKTAFAICQHPKVLTVAPGAAYGAAKRWPAMYFQKVCRYWIDNGGFVVIVGTPSEQKIATEVASGFDSKSCIDLCGKTQLDELMLIISSSQAVVANDSGIMHLGAALGKPGVAVFGPTDHTATGPVSPKWKLVITEEKCGPCFKRVCPRNNPVCMLNISPDEVIAALKELAG